MNEKWNRKGKWFIMASGQDLIPWFMAAFSMLAGCITVLRPKRIVKYHFADGLHDEQLNCSTKYYDCLFIN